MTAYALPSFTEHEPSAPGAPTRRDGCRWRSTSPAATASNAATPHVFSTGTNLVVGLDEKLILKIFPPMLRRPVRLGARLRWRSFAAAASPIPEIVVRRRARRLAVSRDHAPVRPSGFRGVAVAAGRSEGARAAQIGETIAEVQRAPLGELPANRAALGLSSPGRSRDAGPGTRGSDCRENSSPGSKTSCVTPRR